MKVHLELVVGIVALTAVTATADVHRLRIVREALAGFCSAVERTQPNSRVLRLGLA